ncbi:MAG: DUF423 domain-containing protein [Polaribacter sp.]|jgi:uncharacterized membrane protein YgdD (TMEM256/DUF423 family)|nr:DUF423 domain-containing protein [Polaribacter sp.]MBT4780386.1 DUF423 domain-containing protein [Polaribacter sp.]MBT5098847.1 DUF423 domain-containing protein [Polaribacter sp.]MBT5645435.1 DUF423 domain-containing protein [Polaribacter sp.]MBT7705309.1 DUF423 domain-containing protein [Polaribacter sp.]MDA9092862.1 DUF423 domain-containing protein [Polaribacter sp.]
MNEIVLVFAAFLGASGIIFGAFGAHFLKKKLTTEQLQSFETGVKYQMYHALVLLVLGFQLEFDSTLKNSIFLLLIVGIVLFSFSIYGLVLSSASNKKIRFLGPMTPFGGLLLVLGWGLLMYLFLSAL